MKASEFLFRHILLRDYHNLRPYPDVTEGRSSGVPRKLVQPSSALCYRPGALRPPAPAPAPDVSPGKLIAQDEGHKHRQWQEVFPDGRKERNCFRVRLVILSWNFR